MKNVLSPSWSIPEFFKIFSTPYFRYRAFKKCPFPVFFEKSPFFDLNMQAVLEKKDDDMFFRKLSQLHDKITNWLLSAFFWLFLALVREKMVEKQARYFFLIWSRQLIPCQKIHKKPVSQIGTRQFLQYRAKTVKKALIFAMSMTKLSRSSATNGQFSN